MHNTLCFLVFGTVNSKHVGFLTLFGHIKSLIFLFFKIVFHFWFSTFCHFGPFLGHLVLRNGAGR